MFPKRKTLFHLWLLTPPNTTSSLWGLDSSLHWTRISNTGPVRNNYNRTSRDKSPELIKLSGVNDVVSLLELEQEQFSHTTGSCWNQLAESLAFHNLTGTQIFSYLHVIHSHNSHSHLPTLARLLLCYQYHTILQDLLHIN